jgi:hypothetical protein
VTKPEGRRGARHDVPGSILARADAVVEPGSEPTAATGRLVPEALAQSEVGSLVAGTFANLSTRQVLSVDKSILAKMAEQLNVGLIRDYL